MRDEAPIGNTCPMIDKVISFLQSIEWNLDDELEAEFNEQSLEAVGVMEYIRQANQTLREWGNDLYRDKDDLEKEVYEANRRIEDLEQEIADLNRKLERSEAEVDRLDDKVQELYSQQTG